MSAVRTHGMSFTTIVANGIVPPPNIGPRSIQGAAGLAKANYTALVQGAVATASTGEKIFCGPADDPFFVDLGGAFDLGNFPSARQFDQPDQRWCRAFQCALNCHSSAGSYFAKTGKTVAMATNILDGDFVIGLWASASRQEMQTLGVNGAQPSNTGNWIQVSRLGMPLTNEVIIPLVDKDKWNAVTPAGDLQFAKYFSNPELALYMDDSQFGSAVPSLNALRIQTKSLGSFDFRNGKKGLWSLKGSAAVKGTALDDAIFGTILLPDTTSPRAVDIFPIFYTGVPNLPPYQLATGKKVTPFSPGKPFINNFLPTLGDMLRLNMAVPATPRNDPKFSSLGIINAAVLGLDRSGLQSAMPTFRLYRTWMDFLTVEDWKTMLLPSNLQAVAGVALAAIGLWYDDYKGMRQCRLLPDLGKVFGFTAGPTQNDTTFRASFPIRTRAMERI